MSSIGELLLLLLVVAAAGGAALLYMQKRDRGRTSMVTPYAEGLRFMLDGDRPRAIQKLRDVVAADSSNLDAYLRLGTLIAESGDPVRAVKIHRSLTFRGDMTDTQKVAVFRALAEDYLRMGDISRALDAIEHMLALSKKDVWALERKVELLVGQHEWPGASEAAQRLANLSPTITPHFLAVLKTQEGLRCCETKKERDGRIQFREAVKLENTLVAPYLYWGDSYVREGRVEDAVRIWRRMISASPAKAHLVFDRLESHLFDLGRFSEIEQVYRTLIRSYPQSVHAYSALSRYLNKRGDRGDAIAVLMDGLHHNPESLWLRRLLVQMHGEVHDVERVLDLARDILMRVMKEQYEFKCGSCGHVMQEPAWLCPKCGKLDTFHA
jgi:lipopolysaccharide assembly protein B